MPSGFATPLKIKNRQASCSKKLASRNSLLERLVLNFPRNGKLAHRDQKQVFLSKII